MQWLVDASKEINCNLATVFGLKFLIGVTTLGPGIWVGDGRGLNFARPRD